MNYLTANYTYFKKPAETLRQFSDYTINQNDYYNWQKSKCTDVYASDVWVSTFDRCAKYYPTFEPVEFFTAYKVASKKYCLYIGVKLQDCTSDRDLACYVNMFYSRYTGQNAFLTCEPFKAQIMSSINNYLKFAKNEDIVKLTLTDILNWYKGNFTVLVQQRYDIYKKRLRDNYNNFTNSSTLIPACCIIARNVPLSNSMWLGTTT